MAYKIQFNNGHTIEFDSQPSDSDIDEAFAHTQTLPAPKAQDAGPSALRQLGQNFLGLGAAGVDVLGGLAKMPLGIGASIGAKLRGGGDYTTDELRKAGQAEVERLIPSMGKATGLETNPTYQASMKPFEWIGEAVDWAGNKIGQATGSQEMAGATKLGLDIASLGVGIPGAKLAGKGLAKIAETVDPGLRDAGKPPTKRSSVDNLVAEINNPEPVAKGQQEMFPRTEEGLATPYDAGQQGVFSPTTPLRQRRQMELQLEHPEQVNVDTAGVSIPPEQYRAVEVAKQAELARMDEMARQQGNQDFLGAKQQEMWATDHPGDLAPSGEMAQRASRELPPELRNQDEMFGQPELFDLQREGEMASKAPIPELTKQGDWVGDREQNRAYTDMRAAEGAGERPFTRQEFEKIVDNLAKEPGTKYDRPADIDKAYKDYVEQVSSKQTDMFDVGSRQEAFRAESTADRFQRSVEEHPFVKAAEDKLAKQEQHVQKLTEQVQAGKANATTLLSAKAALSTARETAAKAHANITEALSKGAGPKPGENPFGSDIVSMHSGIPFTKEHWNKLKEVGNALIENSQQAIAFAANTSDVKQNMVQQGINALTKGGSYLKAKVNNPVVHFAVDRMLSAEGKARSQINEKIHKEYLSSLRELSKTEYNDTFKLLDNSDKTQTVITKEMMTKHGISEKVQNAVLQHQALMADVLKQINVAREAAGKKPITSRTGYSAMNMSGDFRKTVYKMVNGEREVVGVIGANSKTLGKNSLSKLEELIKQKNPEYEFGPLQDTSVSRSSRMGTPNEAFKDVLDTIGENNPNFAEFVKTLNEVHRDNPNNFLGMQQHTMQKKGVWGMEGRKQWLTGSENAKAFFENQVRYAESAYQWGEMAKAAVDVSTVLHDPMVMKDHPNASKLAQDYLNNAMGIEPSRMGKAVDAGISALFAPFGIGPGVPKAGINVAKQVANTMMMSLSPTFLAIQMLQPLVALPAMNLYLRGKGVDSWGVGGVSKAMGTLYKQVSGKPLNALEQGAVDYAKNNHVYATDMVQHSTSTSKDTAYYVNKATQAPQAHVETGTRAAVFHALVNTLHDGGLTAEHGLYEQAHRFTDMAMNNYSQMEKPPIYNALGALGSMAYNLKSFGHNELSRWALYAREIGNSGNATPLLAQMASTIAFAGLMGLPFYSQWDQLYGFITKKLGEERSLTLDTLKLSETVGEKLGPKGSYALSNGMFTLAGADISSRVGLGDVLPSSAGDAAFAGGGKLVEMAKATGRAAMSPSEENLKAAALNLAPPFMQGMMKDQWYTKGDLAYSTDPTKLRATAEINDVDRLLGKIGLLGINKSVQQTKNYELKQLDLGYKSIRETALNKMAQDIFRDRPISRESIDKYIKNGQGDPKALEAALIQKGVDLSTSPQNAALIKDAASTNVTRQQSLMRRVQ